MFCDTYRLPSFLFLVLLVCLIYPFLFWLYNNDSFVNSSSPFIVFIITISSIITIHCVSLQGLPSLQFFLSRSFFLYPLCSFFNFSIFLIQTLQVLCKSFSRFTSFILFISNTIFINLNFCGYQTHFPESLRFRLLNFLSIDVFRIKCINLRSLSFAFWDFRRILILIKP